ncbi:carboxyl transferase domain-containing protein [Ochromonadaceae sp. CCMP2298]|nr:carboxyl transferase domain-containing protein [Ochromonadaceae sp. CCMP2298]|mmetsp:Transcript_36269/g.80539  ORF Transcript_36269/g.80539 Transcript_36269/m.80539 type:complete len:2279 (-) Transcript_36269:131-6967(-)
MASKLDLTDAGFFKSVEDFVAFSGGDHAIKKILIANNGIGATKAIRSIRRWCFETFGNERMVEFVVMATPEDMRANAEYIRLADRVVDVPGGSNNNNYANINLICQIAQHLKVDAVMPMWGHASENPSLPTNLLKLKHRVTFIGPPAEPMQALGDKIGSTIIAQSAGVPTIAWNGDGLTVDYQTSGIPQEVYDQANVTTAEDALACAERIGYPVMIKASEGGGGKGIRKVLRSEDVAVLFRQVQGEIPGSPIFVMKMASQARHLEVQLIADKYGNAVALSGRDCSVQRRHQKIIEEGPPTAAPKEVFQRMERAAVSLAKTVGYCNAGTVEFLYLEETQQFAFLELNPRLQVEHPVTENILNLNLPACQLQVAMGLPLHRMGDIRKMYGRHRLGADTIDFDYAEKVPYPHHCIAVRVTAENPEAGFQPTSGSIQELHFHSAIDVWGYFSVNNSGLIHEFADSQFGHIFAGGVDRESARRAMIVALKELQIRGDIRTTQEYIIKMLQSEDFIANRINTDWLDGRIARHAEISKEEAVLYCPHPTLVATCGAALQGYQYFLTRDETFVNLLKVGQVPPQGDLSPVTGIDLIFDNIKYKTTCVQSGGEDVIVQCNQQSQNVSVRTLADGGYLLKVAGRNHVAYVREESGGSLRMVLDSHTCMFTPEYDPTKLRSAVAGKLARLLLEDGAHVEKGQAFVEIEVMKMFMPLKALEAGTVSFQMSEGAALSAGDVIALVQLDNPDSVVTAEEFRGPLQEGAEEKEEDEVLAHMQQLQAQKSLEQVLEGYPLTEEEIRSAMALFVASWRDASLPVLKVEAAMSVLRGRIDANLTDTILRLNEEYRQNSVEGGGGSYPAAEILLAIQATIQATPIAARAALITQTAELWAVVEPYLFSLEEVVLSAVSGLLENYLSVEKQFDNMSFADMVNKLRKDHAEDLQKVLLLCRSHVNVRAKNLLVLEIIEQIKAVPHYASIKRPRVPLGIAVRKELHTRKIKVHLTELSKLRESKYTHISFAANLLLIDQLKMTLETRRSRLDETLVGALTTGEPIGQGDRTARMLSFVNTNVVIRDILVDALRHDTDYQIAAIELYVRKIYQKTHDLQNLEAGNSLGEGPNCWVTFEFKTKFVEALVDDASGRTPSYTDLAAFSRTSLQNMGSQDSFGEPSSPNKNRPIVQGMRRGVFAVAEGIDDLPTLFPQIAAKIPHDSAREAPINAVHVLLMLCGGLADDQLAQKLASFLSSQAADLDSRSVRRVSFFVGRPRDGRREAMPLVFTFRARTGFTEDRLFRHIEAPHAFHLDLPRLSNFAISLEDGIQTASGNVHLYRAVPLTGKGARRFFARLVSFTADVHSSDVESLYVEALDHLSLVRGEEADNKGSGRAPPPSAANHVFMNVVAPDAVVQPDFYENLLQKLCTKYSLKMMRQGITTVELKLACRLSAESEPMFLRLVASNPTGFVLNIDKYYEAHSNGTTVYKCINRGPAGPLDGLNVGTPYEVSQKFETQRAAAMAASETLYCYDWPALFECAADKRWTDYFTERSSSPRLAHPLSLAPPNFFSCSELALCDPTTRLPMGPGWTAAEGEACGVLLPVRRSPGLNDVGMVAWLIKIASPECPEGREVVIICNDITFQAGSFGTREDVVFFKASEYARHKGVARIFLTANSGARIGMAQSLKDKFQVCFVDEKDPSKGYRYIYISKEVYVALLAKNNGDVSKLPLICSEVQLNGQSVYRVSDIIGEEPDLGVENLMGSGLIAGETSRAYNDIFTLTLVVGRTVGIGAYLVRLGQRTIQKTRSAPIILTGFQALNKLMGREIYTTNDQLGGPMIMFPNGVSHLLAETHLDTVSKALEWMSFVPSTRGGPLPVRSIEGIDQLERAVTFAPQKGVTYDPRLLLDGLTVGDCWQSGFFDRNSFVEVLSGWAKTVVVGRGRLGGIPMGVIVTENRTAEATKPADPADLTSQEKLVQQAGGVWFPDSAYKTAQALRDFNREGLPCMIFANWRGFSGGQRDMFDEVLKFGSMIVDALVAYQQPLFVYIPPFAELRGGAWVVVDSTINADVMEFYAAEDARGGVLEAAGAASIKFRDRDIVATAHRLDPALVALDAELAALKGAGKELEAVLKQIASRERMLFGVYQQVAVHFADLHDTPGRMQAKGVIRRQVQWAQSRAFFYWRLKRRLKEFEIVNAIGAEDGPGARRAGISALKVWFLSQGGSEGAWEEDQLLVQWFEQHADQLAGYVAQARSKACIGEIGAKLAQLVGAASGSADSAEVLKQALRSLPEAERAQILAALK